MEVWKIVFLISFSVAVVQCDDETVNVAENEVESANSNANLIRQKKSHPSATCVPGENGDCNSDVPDDEYTVSSSSNYFAPAVQSGYRSSTQMQQQRPSFVSQTRPYIVQPGYGQPPPYAPSHYPPASYKPLPPAAYGPIQPPKSTYSVPPQQPYPQKSVYEAPIQPLYRSYDMMDQQVGISEMMDQQVGTYPRRQPVPNCIPYQPVSAAVPLSPAPIAPASCGQQFSISCTPQLYAVPKPHHYEQPPPVYIPSQPYAPPSPSYAPQTPSYTPSAPSYGPPAPSYAPQKPTYQQSPTVYASEPASMYPVQAQNSQPQQPQQPQSPQNMLNSSADPKMMNTNTQTASGKGNESSDQQQSQPKNDSEPPKGNNMLKLTDQMKENEKRSGPNSSVKFYAWEKQK